MRFIFVICLLDLYDLADFADFDDLNGLANLADFSEHNCTFIGFIWSFHKIKTVYLTRSLFFITFFITCFTIFLS